MFYKREHYKSWSEIKKRAEGLLCESLKGRVSYFFTYYHEVHNAYGRAAIRGGWEGAGLLFLDRDVPAGKRHGEVPYRGLCG